MSALGCCCPGDQLGVPGPESQAVSNLDTPALSRSLASSLLPQGLSSLAQDHSSQDGPCAQKGDGRDREQGSSCLLGGRGAPFPSPKRSPWPSGGSCPSPTAGCQAGQGYSGPGLGQGTSLEQVGPNRATPVSRAPSWEEGAEPPSLPPVDWEAHASQRGALGLSWSLWSSWSPRRFLISTVNSSCV